MKKVYTCEELLCIQHQLENFIHFVKKYDSKPLPRCFHFCHLIIKNIGICEKNAWDGIEELSEYILQDWEAAMEIHPGLPEYYILGETNLETQKLNEEIQNHILNVDKLISRW